MSKALRQEIAIGTGLAAMGLWFSGKRGLSVLAGLTTLGLRYWPSSESFAGRTVAITGGSRGLGLALAEQFLRQGAKVALIARNLDDLAAAQKLLKERTGSTPMVVSADVTRRDDLVRAIHEIEAELGRIAIWVNDAGAITVGPFALMERADFDALFELQVHAVANSTQLLLERWGKKGGRIVNICSIGGKIPVPHLSAYCAAKFAMAGLSQTLGTELAGQGVRVTTVYPGLMRTGSPIQAVIKGSHESEYAWFAVGDIAPGLSISAEAAARKILAGVRDGYREVIFPSTSRLAILAQAQFPELFALASSLMARLLPSGESTVRKTGAESKGWLERQLWYRLVKPRIDSTQLRGNQTERRDAEFNLGVRP